MAEPQQDTRVMHALLQLGQGLVSHPGQGRRHRAPLHALCTDVLSFKGAPQTLG